MAKGKKVIVLFIMFIMPVIFIQAQTPPDNSSFMSGSEMPQWVRDLRRYEIVAFGSFPFTMLFSTMAMDLTRWQKHNGMDWSDRRYAPWPIKSAGAIAMEGDEQKKTIYIAIGASLTIAVADFIIVQIRRSINRRRAEILPAGTTIINRIPWGEGPPEEQNTEEEPPVMEFAPLPP